MKHQVISRLGQANMKLMMNSSDKAVGKQFSKQVGVPVSESTIYGGLRMSSFSAEKEVTNKFLQNGRSSQKQIQQFIE
jgi:nitrogenase molybdenum-iron protein alpha/beta subunit